MKVGDYVAVSAELVFNSAMVLMDEQSQDGTFDGYPDDYKTKTWSILTLLQSELLTASETPNIITSKSDLLILDDRTALTVLPYGLAAQLLLNDEDPRTNFFNSRYEELKRKRPTSIVKIEDVYGINQNYNDVSVNTDVDGGDF